MFSFFSLALLAIAAQSLFIDVQAVVLRQSRSFCPASFARSANPPSVAKRQNSTFSLSGDSGPSGPLNFTATYGLGDEGNNPLAAFFQQFIPIFVNGLTGFDNSVSVTGDPDRSPLSVGLGFLPANLAEAPGQFVTNATSFYEIIASLLSSASGYNVTVSPVSTLGTGSDSFNPRDVLPSTLSSFSAVMPSGSPPALPSDFSTVLPSGFPSGFPSGLSLPSDLPSGLPSGLSGHPLPSKLPSIATSISTGLPSVSTPEA